VLLLCTRVAAAHGADNVVVDFSGYQAACGIEARQTDNTLRISWPANERETCQLWLDFSPGSSLIDRIAITSNATAKQTSLLRYLEPVTRVTVGSRKGADGRPPGMSPFNEFFDSPASRPNTQHAATLDRKHVRVSSQNQRATVAIGDLTMGPFSGELEITIYAGSPLLHLETVVRATEPNLAYFYEMGLSSHDEASMPWYAWIDTEGTFRMARNSAHAPMRVRHRTIVCENSGASVACFPPPHQFFFPRDYTDNLGYVWAEPRGFGIRQAATGGGSFSPWFNAPPETDQRMGMFLLLSSREANVALSEVLKYTRGDEFAKLPGHITFTSHWHMAIAMAAQQEIAKGAGRTIPDFVRMFKGMGVNIVHVAEFHGDGHPQDAGPVRLAEMRSMFAECRRLSDDELLLLPGEEANVHLGRAPGKQPGHWVYLFPKPVYWTMKRASGQLFVEQDPALGTVYHVGDQADMFRLLKEERALAWTAHARIKASSWAPDIYRDQDFFRSETWLGAAWKAMPADLSRARLGERVLDLLDDMNEWGCKKYLLGEVDVFKLDHTHELYGHMNVNYLRLKQIPRFDEGWSPILDALRNGAFFVSTGEVLIRNYSVGGKLSGETYSTQGEGRPDVQIDLEWTFPLRFADLVVGNGGVVWRERVDLTDTAAFGQRSIKLKPDLNGATWVRIEAWDVAGNGAFSQPVWIEP
jgi:hypothetical protein